MRVSALPAVQAHDESMDAALAAYWDLAPHLRRTADGPLRGEVVVLVPAHNEEACIANTLESLKRQSRRPDRIIVIADNCTDDTTGIAAAHGAEVIATVGNQYKKAGALNQVLDQILPSLDASDGVLVMDADSELDPAWIELAETRLQQGYAACGGVFTGRSGGRLVGMLQRNEYARYRARRAPPEWENSGPDRDGHFVQGRGSHGGDRGPPNWATTRRASRV